MSRTRYLFLLTLFLTLISCGSSSPSILGGTGDSEEDGEVDNSVNTEKLIGTPFEGKTLGDDISWEYFQEGDYLTTTVDYVPIPIFLAYFTISEEEEINEGVALANEGAGFEAFEIIEEWQNDARVIYKVDDIADPESVPLFAGGHTFSTEAVFGGTFSDVVVVDWQIELDINTISKWVTAHELGHAFGIGSHALINYETDSLEDLEENSIMESDGGTALNDYNYMMQMQGQLLLDHLGEGEATPDS